MQLKYNKLIYIILIFGLILPAGAWAADLPTPPAMYYGALTITDGSGSQQVPAPAGVTLVAQTAGQEVGRLTTEETGSYGGPTATEPKLLIGALEEVSEGAVINFLIEGVPADQSATFHPLEVVQLDLTVKDEQGPNVFSLEPGNGSTVDDTRRPTISASIADNLAGVETDSIQVRLDGDLVDAHITLESIQYTPGENLANGSHVVKVMLRDMVGNETTKEWSFTLDVPELTGITLEPSEAEIWVGETRQFRATAQYQNRPDRDVTTEANWTSSDEGIATVEDGLVTAIDEGTATITAQFGNFTARASVEISTPEVTSVTVVPATASVAVGGTKQFQAEAQLENGETLDVTHGADWSSSDNGVATVNSQGLATGNSAGTATITATYGGQSGSATLTVTEGSVPGPGGPGGSGGAPAGGSIPDADQVNENARQETSRIQQELSSGQINAQEAAQQVAQLVDSLEGVEATSETVQQLQQTISAMLQAAGTVDSSGLSIESGDDSANITVSASMIEQQINQVTAVIETLNNSLAGSSLGEDINVTPQIVVNVPDSVNQPNITVSIPGNAMQQINQAGVNLVVQTPQTSFTIPPSALPVTGDNEQVEISVSVVSSEQSQQMLAQLPASESEQLSPVGQILDLTINTVNTQTNESTPVDNFNGPIKALFSYDPDNVEDPELLGLYVLDEETNEWVYVPSNVYPELYAVGWDAEHMSFYTLMEYRKVFKDTINHWAKREIQVMAARHIARGVTPETFEPNGQVTRAQFAALLVRTLRLKPDMAGAASFEDVPENAWYRGEVGAAVKAGLVTGYDATHFGPEDLVTREQMATMIARAMKFEKAASYPPAEVVESTLRAFEDQLNIASWAREGSALMVKQGIIKGRTPTEFAPKGKATRAESTVMLKRLLDKLVSNFL